MIGGHEAEVIGEACLIVTGLKSATVEAEKQGLPAIAARMAQAADCIEALVNLLARR